MFSISGIIDEKKYRDTIQTIVNIFESTRIVRKFQSWKSETIQKAFKWADVMTDFEARPSIEKRSLVSSYFYSKLDFFDISGSAKELMFIPAMKPIHLTFWIVLTSPILNCNIQANAVVTEVIKQTITRIGTVETYSTITTLMKYLGSRNRFEELHSHLQIPFWNDKFVDAQSCLFAYHFIISFAVSKLVLMSPEDSSRVNHQMRSLILNDAMTLKSVALALVLPSSYIMFRYTHSYCKISHDQNGPPKISLDDALRTSRDTGLWNMITDAVDANVTRFFHLDTDFVICQQLCTLNERFLCQFVKALKDLIYPQWFLVDVVDKCQGKIEQSFMFNNLIG